MSNKTNTAENLKGAAFFIAAAAGGFFVWTKYGNKTDEQKLADDAKAKREGTEALRKEQERTRIANASANSSWFDKGLFDPFARVLSPFDTAKEVGVSLDTKLRDLIGWGEGNKVGMGDSKRVWIKRRPRDVNGKELIVRLEWDGSSNKQPLVTATWYPSSGWVKATPAQPLHASWGRQWIHWPDVSPAELGQKPIANVKPA